MERYEVTLLHLFRNTEQPLTILADAGETSENIILTAEIDGRTVTGEDFNYLPAYQMLRDRLLELGYGLKCCGSRLNALQSGMMGANDRIYLVELGRPARQRDIVGIFDYDDLTEFPITRQQLAFQEAYCQPF